jgi:hypothetical protein
MAGPTDILTEDVKDLRETNRQLASEIKGVFERLSAEMRDSNQRLADAINRVAKDVGDLRVEATKGLGDFRTEVTRELSDFRLEVTTDLGSINTSLGKYQTKTDDYLSVAKWAAGATTTVVLGLVVWSYSAYSRAVHIEESIIALRDHAEKQDRRIDKMLELLGQKEQAPLRPIPIPTDPHSKTLAPPTGNPSGDNRHAAPGSSSRRLTVAASRLLLNIDHISDDEYSSESSSENSPQDEDGPGGLITAGNSSESSSELGAEDRDGGDVVASDGQRRLRPGTTRSLQVVQGARGTSDGQQRLRPGTTATRQSAGKKMAP